MVFTHVHAWLICISYMYFNMYLDNIHSCSCIAYMLVLLVHTKCLIKCPNDILVLFWTPMSTKLWGLLWLDMFIMFWSLGMCFAHFDPNVLSHTLHMHHICTPHAHLMHTLVHLSCFCISIMVVICHYMFITYNMIVCHCLCLFRAFVFVLWTNLVLIKFMFLFMCFCTCIFVFVSVFANASLQEISCERG